jgi:tRNA threonylcarbamoyladenosine biosynthesis protein TsaB
MRIIGIDTATAFGSVGLVEDGRVVAERSWEAASGHARKLAPTVRAVCEAAGWAPTSAEAVAISIGPGSFTGLRIGLGFAKGLAYAGKMAMVPVPTLDALAPVADGDPGELVCPILDARRGEVYAALYAIPERGRLEQLWGPELVRPGELVGRISSRCRFLGDGVATYAGQIESALGRDAVLLPFSHYHPAGGAVALEGMRGFVAGRAQPIGQLEPDYVRAAYAEVPKNPDGEAPR